MSVHTSQVASVIQRAVQGILARGLSDPRVRGLVSVTGVKLTDDGAQATILVSVLPAEHAELTLHGLRHAAGHIRTELGREVKVRRLPSLLFKLDKSIKKQSEVLTALAAVRPADADAAEAAADHESPPFRLETPET
jgi:ribosome-binding factor A